MQLRPALLKADTSCANYTGHILISGSEVRALHGSPLDSGNLVVVEDEKPKRCPNLLELVCTCTTCQGSWETIVSVRRGLISQMNHSSAWRLTSYRESIKSPIRIPLSPANAVKCYPCREVSLNYSESLLFHGGKHGFDSRTGRQSSNTKIWFGAFTGVASNRANKHHDAGFDSGFRVE